jgi:hypothetical protein
MSNCQSDMTVINLSKEMITDEDRRQTQRAAKTADSAS